MAVYVFVELIVELNVQFKDVIELALFFRFEHLGIIIIIILNSKVCLNLSSIFFHQSSERNTVCDFVSAFSLGEGFENRV